MEPSELIKLLSEWGLTPLNGILIYVIVTLWKSSKAKDEAQDTKRENAHAETQKKMASAQEEIKTLVARADICERDREKLKSDHEVIKRELQQFAMCPHLECPVKHKR